MLVLDYSAGTPNPVTIRRAGYSGAVRYIGFPNRTKCTSKAELRAFDAERLGMALVYEDNADDWRGGYPRGIDAARRARNHADAIGFPKDRPIYMAIDRDVVSAAEFTTAVEYLRGANRVLGVGLTGVYGEHDMCSRAAASRVASWFWQTRAWSGTPVKLYPHRHLYQRVGTVHVGGIACDINDVLAPDWGQHNARKENDVEFTDEWDEKELTALGPGKFGHALLRIKQDVSATRKLVGAQGGAITALSRLVATDAANDLTADQVEQIVAAEIRAALAEHEEDTTDATAAEPAVPGGTDSTTLGRDDVARD